ncbi:hypothetical protein RJT34_00506 [Clitoria ternatea]|uniref:Uncharacterized protein n=1 Tax=Clitoria ternatea TaxID=43366 RepID=A0AAN9Q0P7_CLITE
MNEVRYALMSHTSLEHAPSCNPPHLLPLLRRQLLPLSSHIINPYHFPFIFYHFPKKQTHTHTQRKPVPFLSPSTSLATDKAMGFLKAIFLIAITMALSITLTMKTIIQKEPSFVPSQQQQQQQPQQPLLLPHHEKNLLLPPKRANRFLAQIKNPNAADHCHKDHEICSLQGAKNSTCCNNKCIDVGYDKHNCGACKKKCKFTETCCRGQCVDTNYDKRHCGECNHRCERGQYCVFGMCDYA